jgi:hypothetical protein
MNSYLIDNLLDIIIDYLDTQEYIKLKNLYPKVFTRNRLVKKLTDNIPLNELSIISKSYDYSKEWLDMMRFMEMKQKIKRYDNIKPLYLLGVFNEIVHMYDHIDISRLDSMDQIVNFSTHIFDLGDKVIKSGKQLERNIRANIDIKNIFICTNNNFKIKFKEYLKYDQYTDDDDDDLLYNFELEYSASIMEEIVNNPNFYPLSNLEKYNNKILEITLERLKN